MRDQIKKISLFILPYLFFVLVGLAYFFVQDPGDLAIWLSKKQIVFLDHAFKYLAYLGDWFFMVAVTLVVVFFKFRSGVVLGIALICQVCIHFLIKFLLFEEGPKASGLFEGQRILDLIDHTKVQDFSSFPSSQASAIFTLCLLLSLFFDRRSYTWLLLGVALVISFGQVYLGYHFLIDIIVGSLIGVLVAILVYFLLEKYLDDKAPNTSDPEGDLSHMNLNTDDVDADL